jgi:hypothetical protein
LEFLVRFLKFKIGLRFEGFKFILILNILTLHLMRTNFKPDILLLQLLQNLQLILCDSSGAKLLLDKADILQICLKLLDLLFVHILFIR